MCLEHDVERPREGLVASIQAGYGLKLARLTGTPLLRDEDCSFLDKPLGKLQRTIGKLPHQASQYITGPRKGLKPESSQTVRPWGLTVWLLVGRRIPGLVPARECDITASFVNLPPGARARARASSSVALIGPFERVLICVSAIAAQ